MFNVEVYTYHNISLPAKVRPYLIPYIAFIPVVNNIIFQALRIDSGRFATNSKCIEFGQWNIAYDVSCILPSVCSTKVVCERDDEQFCQFCM